MKSYILMVGALCVSLPACTSDTSDTGEPPSPGRQIFEQYLDANNEALLAYCDLADLLECVNDVFDECSEFTTSRPPLGPEEECAIAAIDAHYDENVSVFDCYIAAAQARTQCLRAITECNSTTETDIEDCLSTTGQSSEACLDGVTDAYFEAAQACYPDE